MPQFDDMAALAEYIDTHPIAQLNQLESAEVAKCIQSTADLQKFLAHIKSDPSKEALLVKLDYEILNTALPTVDSLFTLFKHSDVLQVMNLFRYLTLVEVHLAQRKTISCLEY